MRTENENFATDDELILRYGANENDNWHGFTYDTLPSIYHQDAGSKYIRVWISSPSWRPSTIPIDEKGYNFRSLDDYIAKVIDTGATPFIVFAHQPGIIGNAHGELPPKDQSSFIAYIDAVAAHYEEWCVLKGCDPNTWYFEIWNEPFTDNWWETQPSAYSLLFNAASQALHQRFPDAKVGGYTLDFCASCDDTPLLAFLEHSQPDFISIHQYGNTAGADSERQKMSDTKDLYYTQPQRLRSIMDSFDSSMELIISELNSDFRAEYMPTLDEQFTAAWYASSLIWMVKSQAVDIELFYSGTSLQDDGGFGMWSNTYQTYPIFDSKKDFVAAHQPGQSIMSMTHDSSIDVLVTTEGSTAFITVVNKKNTPVEATLILQDRSSTIVLSAYEVRTWSETID
ncbi:hypothetical protein H6504_04505 [Candidatus Woesearchaeota archaeon]|nr:hypothetical protein [Candidatus Woesearchaeota archaeon]